MTVRQHLADLLNEVRYRRGRTIITRAGKPVAALVDIETFERLRGELSEAFAGQPEDKIRAMVDEAVHAARRHRAEP